MGDAEEERHPNDCLVITLDIEDCPMAEIPLDEVFDAATNTLLDTYPETLRGTIIQQLEDTTWLTDVVMPTLLDAGFGMYHVRERGVILSLRKQSLQRLIVQRLADRARPSTSVRIPVLIRFLIPDVDLPKPPLASITSVSAPASRTSSRRSQPPSVVHTDAPEEDDLSPETVPVSQPAPPPGRSPPGMSSDPATTNPRMGEFQDIDESARTTMFRGVPVDTSATGAGPPGLHRYSTPQEYHPHSSTRPPQSRPLFDSNVTHRTNPLVRTPTRAHPFSAEVTFGAETFEAYMSQFMYSEVKFKDFRKATVPKFDSTKGDSFVHWYKLFCSTCLQWGIWCPPYESAQEDSIHGAWWTLLPMSVRNSDSFMSHLIYSVLIRDTIFPIGSREYSAVEGCPPNAGYHAIYALLRLHHPLLHSVLSSANEIPRQRRNEAFSQFIRRLQDFMARERMATRTYTESEALDLAVRNLLPDWRGEFRRMVERDKRTGPGGVLPFKLSMPQLATTFVEYAAEIGRDPPMPSILRSSERGNTSMIRRIENAPVEPPSDNALGDDEIDLIVRAIVHNQDASSLCLGCNQSGHTLLECNRFVDYIVAESLAQRHPLLKAKVAASHRQFRSRFASASARTRGSTHPSSSRTVRSLQADHSNPTDLESPLPSSEPSASPSHKSVDINDADEEEFSDYRQHSLHIHADDVDTDFEECFADVSIHAVSIHRADDFSPSFVSDFVPVAPETTPSTVLTLRRLEETYDPATASAFAHADNGSMACTTHDRSLLFAYRPITKSTVRLLDAGQHAHHPLGVGFLRIPLVCHPESAGAPTSESSIFIRTYHTPTIPGIIISHSAISKQLGTTGYHLSSYVDKPGFIHFPHRLRRSQDVYMSIQPTAQRGGLTFTEALIVPTSVQHTDALPAASHIHVRRLCTDHTKSFSAATMIDPTDGMSCHECHHSPDPDFCQARH